MAKPIVQDPSDDIVQALEAWKMMGGISWQALPFIVEYLEVKDVELFFNQLFVIRDYFNARRNTN